MGPRRPTSCSLAIRRLLGALVSAATFFLASCGGSSSPVMGPPPPPPDPTIVATQSGRVQGVIEGNLIAFRGIPYAAPPTGDLRWKPPAAPANWQGIRSAATFGNKCPQLDANNNPVGDEDCLSLNIFISNPPPTVKQPVMFFIHGGGNVGGDPQSPPLDSPPLAANDAVVVTVQYRLGLLGFLSTPLLTAEGGGSSGNYGVMDLIAALKWVQTNIGNFGGDSTEVMVFGESEGAINTQALLASPMVQGVFSRAGMESQGLEAGDVYSLSEGAAFYQASVDQMGCDAAPDVLACLRALPAYTVLQSLTVPPVRGTSASSVRLTLEPNVIPVDPFLNLQQNGSPVPLLIGSNATEMTVLVNDLTANLDESGYETRLHALFDPVGPNVADQVLALYPATDYHSPSDAMAHVRSDYYITCKDREIARAAAGFKRKPVFRYLFTHTLENPASFLNGLGAFHFEEVPFVFGNFQNIFGVAYTPTAAETQLSSEMMGYWTRFAATGDPNGSGATQWLNYQATEPMLQLDDTITSIDFYHKDQCDYLATLGPPPV
jgi:para-nitrobenzyl esterase